MKNKIFILIVLVIAIAGGIYLSKVRESRESAVQNLPVAMPFPQNGTYCFAYSQIATKLAPYEVHEHVILTVDGDAVSGTKKGTQNGPDMTNGYEGTLKGTIAENKLEVTYSYVIEGSHNKELELYELHPETLVKIRYPLTEKNGVLVPDKNGEPKMISYAKETCL